MAGKTSGAAQDGETTATRPPGRIGGGTVRRWATRPSVPELTGEQLRQLRSAGVSASDMEVTVTRRAAAELGRFVELLSLADAFCVEQRLLTLARTPGQIAFQNWWFGEISRQLAGEPPTAWNASSWRLRA